MKKWCLLLSKRLGVLLLVVVAMMLSCGINLADENNCTHNNVNFEKKTFEFPSKLHKDGEGFYEVGKMLVPRYGHSSILLNDGRLFIVGGSKNGSIDGILNSTEIFDISTNKSIPGPNLPFPVNEPILFKLYDGRILIIYGANRQQIAIYNPTQNIIEKIINVKFPYLTFRPSTCFVKEINKDEIIIARNNSFPFSHSILYNTRTNIIEDYSTRFSGNYSVSFLLQDNNTFYFTLPPCGNVTKMDNLMRISGKELKNFSINPDTFSKCVKLAKPKGVLTGLCYILKPEVFIAQQNNIYSSKGIMLTDKSKIVLFTPKNKLYLYDIKDNKFVREIPFSEYFSSASIYDIYLLSNNNILIITHNKLYEIDSNTFEIKPKIYETPKSFSWGSLTELNNDKFLYSGGIIPTRNPFKYKYDSVSDKIYLWKTKKENN